MTRRELLQMAALTPLASVTSLQMSRPMDRGALAASLWRVTGLDGRPLQNLRLDRSWQGAVCRSVLTNTGTEPVRVKDIVLFDVRHGFAAEAPFYGEGFQMLTQNGGTVSKPLDLGNY